MELCRNNLRPKNGITRTFSKNNRILFSHSSYGEEAFVIIENNHAPIVTKEVFDRVQEEIARRKTATFERSRYSNRYPFSGKVECAHCKSKFERRLGNKKAVNQVVWRCSEAVKYGSEKVNAQGQKVGCNCKAVHEWFLKENFLAVLNTVRNCAKIICDYFC
jgi:hypothetical protein